MILWIYIHPKARKKSYFEGKKNSSHLIWLFSYMLAIAKYLASNQNNESRASVLRGFHLNKQGNFHFKCMFCHASTKQKSVVSHSMQMPSYPGSYTPPEKHKTFSACSLLSTASFLVQPEVWLQSLKCKVCPTPGFCSYVWLGIQIFWGCCISVSPLTLLSLHRGIYDPQVW